MDYSLQNLNKLGKLKNLTFQDFVEKLNLIGLEVDNISYEKVSTNISLDNIQLLLKIPANREDLLNEVFFIKELSLIFLFEIFQLWENLKKDYLFILKQKYNQYNNYSTTYIKSENKNVITYIVKVENLQTSNSPLWLINKLQNFNLKPKNIVTDIFTLVFSEWGQNINLLNLKNYPSEVSRNFQINFLKNPAIYLEDEKNSLLLEPQTITINVQNEIISFLGYKNVSVENLETNNDNHSFFLEATFYDIHNNFSFLNSSNTKISLKYLRQALINNFKYSFQRLLTLLEILTSCRISNDIHCTKDEKCELETTKILKVNKQIFFNFLQISSPDPIIFKKASLDLVCETKKEYYFKIPIYRKDLLREIDIVEEYSRFIGYKNFNEILPIKSVIYKKYLFRLKNFVKTFFLSYSFNEVITSPMNDYLNKNEFSILITNPLNNELSTLRRSLIPKLLSVFEFNSRSAFPQINIFEIGRTFKQVLGKIIEEDKVGGIFQIPTNKIMKKNSSDWFIAKGFIENFISNFGYKKIEMEMVKKSISYFHSTRSILLKSDNKILGIFGELSPMLVKDQYSHVQGAIYLFEFNMNYFKDWQLDTQVNLFKDYSKYPSITKDLSLTFSQQTDFNQLKIFILSQSLYLKKIAFFDIYFDGISIENVNIGIRFEFQSTTETLTNEFIENELNRIKFLILEKFNLFVRI